MSDHPRLCGEKYPTAVSQVAGSRITPAYAGKRPPQNGQGFSFKDHPRLCGEKLTCDGVAGVYFGSPPPMRGKGVLFTDTAPSAGITPAYAGKSLVPLLFLAPTRDHPRLCGEKEVVAVLPDSVRGSPPPMRGKGTKVFQQIQKSRITPAYAGKSSF